MTLRAPVLGVALLVFAFVLCVVWAIGAVTDEEPYPAVVFPGFGRIPSESSEQRPGFIRVVEIETTNAAAPVAELTAAEAFPEAPDSFHLDMLDSLSEATPSAELRNWAASRLDPPLAAGACVSGLAVVERPSDDVAAGADDRTVNHAIDFGPCESAPAGGG